MWLIILFSLLLNMFDKFLTKNKKQNTFWLEKMLISDFSLWHSYLSLLLQCLKNMKFNLLILLILYSLGFNSSCALDEITDQCIDVVIQHFFPSWWALSLITFSFYQKEIKLSTDNKVLSHCNYEYLFEVICHLVFNVILQFISL